MSINHSPLISNFSRLRNLLFLHEEVSLSLFIILVFSGISSGFLLWTLNLDTREFNSYLFKNNVIPNLRFKLFIYLFCATVFIFILLLISNYLIKSLSDGHIIHDYVKITPILSFGILLGFLPFFAVGAIEVFYPYQTVCLIFIFLLILLLLNYRFYLDYSSNKKSNKENNPTIFTNKVCFRFLLILSISYAVFFCIYTIKKHMSFHSYSFDLGWQNQVFYTLVNTGIPKVTGYVTLNHFSNHFQPIYFLLAPFYLLYQKPETLLILQSVFLAAASIPIYLISMHHNNNPIISLAIGSIYLLYPALHGLNSYDFHGISLLIPILCFLLYSLETGHKKLFWILFILALMTREDVPVTVSGLGLYMLFVKKSRKDGVLILLISVLYFSTTIFLMSAMGGFANMENYWYLTLVENENLKGIITTILTNPFYIFSNAFFNPDKILYLLYLLLPLLFLPLFSGRRMIILFPASAIILLSQTPAQYSIGFQYSAHLIPFMFYLAIYGIDNFCLKVNRKNVNFLIIPLLSAGLLMNYEYGLVFSKRYSGLLFADNREERVFSYFEMIPQKSSLATISRLYPHLSSRNEIYLLHRMKPDTEYVLADLYDARSASDIYESRYRGHALSSEEVRQNILGLLRSRRYGVVRSDNGFILLKSGFDISMNEITISIIQSREYQRNRDLDIYYTDPAENVSNIPRSNSARFENFLKKNKNNTVLLVLTGDGSKNLSYMTKKYLISAGSNIHTLREGGSYIAVIQKGNVVIEKISNTTDVELRSDTSQSLQDYIPGIHILLQSSGSLNDKDAIIQINNIDYSTNQNGFNAVVLNPSNDVIVWKNFDTGGHPLE